MTLRIALAILTAIACTPAFAQEGPAKAPTETPAPAITVAEVERAIIRDRVFASGLIGAVQEVYVQPQIEGQAIEALSVDVGARVEKGQTLAVLSRSKLELQQTQLDASRASAVAALAQGKAQQIEAGSAAEEARRILERAKQLRDSGSVSQAQADQALAASVSADARLTSATQGIEAAQAQIAVVDAQRADADLSLARATVKAPVGGLIAARNASLGEIATASGDPMFVIVRDGLLELRADVAERDILRIAQGQTVSLRVVGLAGSVTGTVRLVEPTVDTVTRLGRVRIELDKPDAVRSGMFAEAAILVAEREAPVAPLSAVEVSDDTSSVLRVGPEGLVTRVPVTIGIRENGRVELLTGVQPGDVIVARAGAFVREGDRITPVRDDAAAPSN